MTDPKAILDLFANRRTIREYEASPLAEGDVDRIIEAGRKAPSGVNAQLYSIIRITDRDLRQRFAELSGGQAHVSIAAEFFVFCVDVRRTDVFLAYRDEKLGQGPQIAIQYGTMDALLVAANMATAAEVLGYGTCFIGAILNRLDEVALALALPEGVMPVVGLTVGVPDANQLPPLKPRLPRALVVHENRYRDTMPEDMEMAIGTMGNNWPNTLKTYFGAGGRLGQREDIWLHTLAQQGFHVDQE